MKTLAVPAAVVMCLAVSACAGTGGANGLAKESRMDNDLDVGKVVTVNQWAVHRHATVVWINYPKAQRKENEG